MTTLPVQEKKRTRALAIIPAIVRMAPTGIVQPPAAGHRPSLPSSKPELVHICRSFCPALDERGSVRALRGRIRAAHANETARAFAEGPVPLPLLSRKETKHAARRARPERGVEFVFASAREDSEVKGEEDYPELPQMRDFFLPSVKFAGSHGVS